MVPIDFTTRRCTKLCIAPLSSIYSTYIPQYSTTNYSKKDSKATLDQIYEPLLAKLSRPGQETVNDQVHWHAQMNFAVQVTAVEQVPPSLQTYTQTTAVLHLQAGQNNYVSTYGL